MVKEWMRVIYVKLDELEVLVGDFESDEAEEGALRICSMGW